jgi:hypothetical protein
MQLDRRTMANRSENNTSQAAVAEINRSIKTVAAEISRRRLASKDVETTKRNRRYISAKAAALSEAADIARTAAGQLVDARTVILDEVASAEAAGFVVQEDFSVCDTMWSSACSSRAQDHSAAIRAALTNVCDLDRQVSSRLLSAANALKELSDN